MNSNLEIDTIKVKECSNNLKEECELFKKEINSFFENVNSLAAVWTTDAQRTFTESAYSNKEYYDGVVLITNNFADLYNYAAVRYESTDTEAGEATSTFK